MRKLNSSDQSHIPSSQSSHTSFRVYRLSSQPDMPDRLHFVSSKFSDVSPRFFSLDFVSLRDRLVRQDDILEREGRILGRVLRAHELGVSSCCDFNIRREGLFLARSELARRGGREEEWQRGRSVGPEKSEGAPITPKKNTSEMIPPLPDKQPGSLANNKKTA